eukprot:8735557-Pyramimonas_sp.AAC.1
MVVPACFSPVPPDASLIAPIYNMTSFYGSSCANNGKDALSTPDMHDIHDIVTLRKVKLRVSPVACSPHLAAVVAACTCRSRFTARTAAASSGLRRSSRLKCPSACTGSQWCEGQGQIPAPCSNGVWLLLFPGPLWVPYVTSQVFQIVSL